MSFLKTLPTHCPYCGERIELVVDSSAGEEEYIEDCSVCCRPMVVVIAMDEDGRVSVMTRQENE